MNKFYCVQETLDSWATQEETIICKNISYC